MNFIFCFFLFCSFFSHALPSFIDYDSVVVVVLRLEIRAIDFHCSVEFYCLVFSFFLRFFPFFLGYFFSFFFFCVRCADFSLGIGSRFARVFMERVLLFVGSFFFVFFLNFDQRRFFLFCFFFFAGFPMNRLGLQFSPFSRDQRGRIN